MWARLWADSPDVVVFRNEHRALLVRYLSPEGELTNVRLTPDQARSLYLALWRIFDGERRE